MEENYVIIRENRLWSYIWNHQEKTMAANPPHFSSGEIVKLEQLDLELPVDLIYEGLF